MDDSTILCRCEEVTFGDLKRAVQAGLTTPGEVRKYTRAGMGSCQGRTCQRLMIQAMKQLLEETVSEDSIRTRTPIQPVRMDALAQWQEE